MAKLKTLRSDLPTLGNRLTELDRKAGATERIRGRPGERMRERIRKRDGYLCSACKAEGVLTPGYQVDHTVPLEQGGSNDDGNQALLCKRHHDIKSGAEQRARFRG